MWGGAVITKAPVLFTRSSKNITYDELLERTAYFTRTVKWVIACCMAGTFPFTDLRLAVGPLYLLFDGY
jgi:hypothetical protein